MSGKKHYPSTSKSQLDNINNNVKHLLYRQKQKNNMQINLNPLVEFKEQGFNHNEWVNRVCDSWNNGVANINQNNSIMQYSTFLLNRLSYQQLASLSTDDIIRNAIGVITREILKEWGAVKISTNNNNVDINKIQVYIKNRFKEINFVNVLNKAINDSLLFGGSFIYFNFDGQQDYSKELVITKETKGNKLLSLKVIEAWLVAPNNVNTSNPLNIDYMKPSKWYVSGAGAVDSTRLYNMVFFEAPDLIKPLFNFLGISLAQLMHDKVKCADIIRQSLSDIFLRFRMDIIKTPALATNNSQMLENRINALNEAKNNLATLMLTDKEDFIQSVTSLSGLDRIQAQAYESIASSATIPINKLFGQTPTGLNNSGAYDLENFNDTIKGYQTNIIKPFIDTILKFILNELDLEVEAEFEFNSLKQLSEVEKAQVNNLEADFYTKLISSGIISQEDALNMLKAKQLVDNNIIMDNDNLDFDMDLDLNEKEANSNKD